MSALARVPGQYYDAETDLVENWNRYYDPSIGRYLEPEPMLQTPDFAQSMAMEGYPAPAYAYALNNPLAFVDVNGLYPWWAPGEDKARAELPSTLIKIAPELTKEEANQLSKDSIDDIGSLDLPGAKSIFDLSERVKAEHRELTMKDLSTDNKDWLSKFVDKEGKKHKNDRLAVDKVISACKKK